MVKLTSDLGKASVHLKILRGDDLEVLSKWQDKEPEAMLEVQVCMAIVRINVEGLKNPIAGMPSIRKFWKTQSWSFGHTLREAVDDAEGGADSTFMHRCDPVKGCSKEQEGVLPLGPEFYGVRRPKRRASARKLFSVQDCEEETTPQESTTS